jgi:hypothetical protein
MDGDDLELGIKSRRTGAGRDPDAIRRDCEDERCPFVCISTDPRSRRWQARLLSLSIQNGLARNSGCAKSLRSGILLQAMA